MSRLLISLIFATAFAQSAFADGLPYTWTGFYFGLNADWQSGRIDDFDSQTQVVGSAPTSPKALGRNSLKMDRLGGGAQLGYNYQFRNNVVVGTELSVGLGGSGDEQLCFPNAVSGSGSIAPYENKCKANSQRTAQWLNKVGLAFGPSANWLAYATGGIAMSQLTVSKNQNFVENTGVPTIGNITVNNAWDGHPMFVGAVLGVGLQYAMTSRLSIGVEYLHSEFAASTYVTSGNRQSSCTGSDPICSGITTVHLFPNSATDQLGSDTVRLILNYRFGD